MGIVECIECDAEMKEKKRFFAVTGDEDNSEPMVVAEYLCPICGHEQMERVEE